MLPMTEPPSVSSERRRALQPAARWDGEAATAMRSMTMADANQQLVDSATKRRSSPRSVNDVRDDFDRLRRELGVA
jgi:hypothetical protein